jgi:hypothetical protein
VLGPRATIKNRVALSPIDINHISVPARRTYIVVMMIAASGNASFSRF